MPRIGIILNRFSSSSDREGIVSDSSLRHRNKILHHGKVDGGKSDNYRKYSLISIINCNKCERKYISAIK